MVTVLNAEPVMNSSSYIRNVEWRKSVRRILLGMDRIEWEKLRENAAGCIVACNCGSMIHSVQTLREHWQQGHFDKPVYQEIKDASPIVETRTSDTKTN